MIKKLTVLTLISFIAASSLFAQINTSSPYSRFGIGEIESDILGRGIGMGGISSGLRLPLEINIANPASYSAIPQKVFLFQVGMKSVRTDYSFGDDDKITNYDFGLSSINAAFGLKKFWGMSFGLNPVSSIGYKVFTEDSVSLGDYTSHLNNTYIGEGGLSKVYWGNAFKFKGFSAGVNASYVFGSLTKRSESLMGESGFNSYLIDSEYSRIKGLHLRYGLQYNDSIFKKYHIVLGGFFENKTDLNADLIRYTTRTMNPNSDISITDTLFNDTSITGSLTTPLSYGFGFSFMTKKLIIGADYKVSNWKDALFFNESSPNLTNSSSISFGAEFTNDYTSKKYIDVINFRIGAYMNNTNLYVKETQIKNQGITFGAGFPTKLGAKINIAFDIGQRGTIENDLIKENYYMIKLNLNFSDSWFIRRKFF